MDISDVDNLLGETLVGDDGEKIGKIEDVYLDADSRAPEWALVHTGLFGRRESFVPLGQATIITGGVHVPYSKALVKDAPSTEPDGNLSPEEEDELYRHYALSADAAVEPAPVETLGGDRAIDDRPAMVRSEEQLHVTTQRRPSHAVRLRKRIIVENVTTTVPVRREVLEVVGDGDQVDDEGAGGPVRRMGADEAHDGEGAELGEVILHEERPVVSLETVATERVRVGRETYVEDTTISQPVRKERVDVEETDTRDTTD